jgi:hypothetical protein
MFGAESIHAARLRGLGLCLNLHPQLALWATGIIASFAGSALCRIVGTPEPSTSEDVNELIWQFPCEKLFV